MQTSYDMTIVGAGTVGMACAIALAQRGLRVLLLEHKPAPVQADFDRRLAHRDARVYALNRASIELFESIGVWQMLSRQADYTRMQVWARDGCGELNFGDGKMMLGSMVEPSVIDYALWCRGQMQDLADYLTVCYEARLCADGMAIDEIADGVVLRFHHGGQQRCVRTSLLLGADGRGSMVRQTVGIGIETLDYHQTAICCAIHTDKAHTQTARQVMLPTGTLALLPIADLHDDDNGRWQSVVWTLPQAVAQDYLADYRHEPDSLRLRLEQASGFELGRILAVESVASFALSAQVASRYHQGRIGLIGDAAHGVHPLAGQGLNLGLLDVIKLLECLDAHKNRYDNTLHPRLLHDYERAAKGHNALMMHSFSLINFAFASGIADLNGFSHLRSEVMNAIGKNRTIMQFFERRASGQ
ncbi:2-octaprenyl-3-methyl-6-methoxy-1,4-benzoquinol hydroxylase [Moraxella pluranimalium]|uniref:2-octaprenyl-3-methyl-6-methoxy-1,4-benzoquinol hydroxylase n=1 Tax=Moraxella pluranimalium TaxID=470453 RepID=A0A1T0CS66_9GAMM|nr:2-octaprenyl-3-methyl-6-methoxy-1,4-benzoquinol hydroxylase [Moraxella pluranimalium]